MSIGCLSFMGDPISVYPPVLHTQTLLHLGDNPIQVVALNATQEDGISMYLTRTEIREIPNGLVTAGTKLYVHGTQYCAGLTEQAIQGYSANDPVSCAKEETYEDGVYPLAFVLALHMNRLEAHEPDRALDSRRRA